MDTPELSIVFATYGQPLMMARQMEVWDSYPHHLQRKLEIVVVDDHGDPPYEFEETKPYPLKIYRVDDDIPWNQMGARNLGMREATAPWRLMLDPDMILTPANLARLMEKLPRCKKGHHYKPQLRPCKKPWGSPNLYVCHIDDFWRAGGYNEDFAGAKGYSDVILHRSLEATSRRHHWEDIWLEFMTRNDVADADVQLSSGVDRDLKRNKKIFQSIVHWAARNRGGWRAYARSVGNHVRFDWHRVR